MIVRLDLHQDVRGFPVARVDTARGIGEEALRFAADHHGGIVVIGGQHAVRGARRRVADHVEERGLLLDPVDEPVRVEDLVAAVFRVRLGEHHQLDVRRVARQFAVAGDQVVDLVLCQGEAEAPVGGDQGFRSGAHHVDAFERAGCLAVEQRLGGIDAVEHGFRHAIVERRGQAQSCIGRDAAEVDGDAALDPAHPVESADPGDVRRLGRPRGDRADPRHDEAHGVAGLGLRRRFARAVTQQCIEGPALVGRGVALQIDEVDVVRRERRNSFSLFSEPREKAGDSRLAIGTRAMQVEHRFLGWSGGPAGVSGCPELSGSGASRSSRGLRSGRSQ